MPWPTPQDYNEAIQSPRLNFSDPELKSGTVETTQLGLPRPISGGFASVYKVRCGKRDWAVRCFLREFLDQQQRYEAISKHLAISKLPYAVGFNFLSQGIKVKGTWYPILKMEWVQGELLHKYIKKNLSNPAALLDLANRWVVMIKALQAANMAHGDLQHGNVLVVNGELRLIDYDGMYVPSLAGQFSHEVGHRNYQHPQRTEFDFGPTIDNFAAWVIYVSLLALSFDPSLWDRVKGGDEYLLFRRDDFEEPFASETLKLLSNHPDQRLDTLAAFFQSLLYISPSQLPALDGQSLIQDVASSYVPVAPSNTKSKPSWLNDYIPSQANIPVSTSSSTMTASNASSSWVIDFISPPESVKQKLTEAKVSKPRLVLYISSIACGLLISLYWTLIISTAATIVFLSTVILIASVFIRDFYHRDSIVNEMRRTLNKEYELNRELEVSQRFIKSAERRKGEIKTKEKIDIKTIDSRQSALREKEGREKAQAQARLNAAISAANGRRQEITRHETDLLKGIQNRIGSEVARLDREISGLMTAESQELSTTLRAQQNQAVMAHLRTRSIDDATIPGVGPKLKTRLWYAGIKTAADVEYWRIRQVDGFGNNKADAVVSWASRIASFARVPSALSPAEINAIKSKYSTKRQQLESKRSAAQQQLTTEVDAIRTQAKQARQLVESEQVKAQNAANQEFQIISGQYVPRYAALQQERSNILAEAIDQTRKLDDEIKELRKKMGEQHWQLAKVRRELMAYKDVSLKAYMRVVLGFYSRHQRKAMQKP
ncbi:MAG: hypothetical protein M3362_04720 [Acidobacteriota bacterium]|nr:hypothetical protein [Acidobacteriota bacterium]